MPDASRQQSPELNSTMRPGEDGASGATSGRVGLPSVSLPKGGGAIRGIGEKFAANPVTGTGSMTVPIATSPGRSGFGPQLSLSYDSGAGNGPFGFGWSLSLPSIIRKTDKGLPQYRDADESDEFILSGAEDLVPEFEKDAVGNWVLKDSKHVIHEKPRTVGAITYTVRRYRPRIEGLFARIERWTNTNDHSDVHWRSISRDNILTLYGKDANSRIYDPEDPTRIFSWLICETRDDKGNGVLYKYSSENGDGVDLALANERNRGARNDTRRTANRYLKHIYYGNRTPMLDNAGQRPRLLTAAQIHNAGWLFEVVFDYGEHDANAPKPKDDEERDQNGVIKNPWHYRSDPFSSYRAGFEVRTTRLCQRVLMFHHFPGEVGVGQDCLVRSIDFTYSHEQDPANARNPIYTFLHAVTQTGYKRNGVGYLNRSLPPIEFEYTQPVVQDTVEDVDHASLENLPIGVDGAAYQWIDLHGEGIPGILTEQAGAWFYKRNLSPIGEHPVEFAPLELVAAKPNLALDSGARFMDLAGDGQPDLVVLGGPTPGLYEHDGEESWKPFRSFTSRLNRDTRDPNLRFVDLDGDGHADVLITEDDAFVWHASLAEEGFGPALRVHQALDEEKGPRLVFADGTQSVYLADLSGDGLTDLVRIRNGEVCYWPNLGYGRFGAKVTMDDAPHFDHPDQFDQKRIRLADIDGTGTTDIIYLHGNGVRLYFNQSGNGWSQPHVLNAFPRVDDLVSIVATDLLGNGTACLVWSSPLPNDAGRPMHYINLMGMQKPHLLVRSVNNLGAETRVQYAPSTEFYLRDKRDGKPWITRLPFPVHVVERVETYDHISRNRFVTRYAYHHGYFDGEEREFRGFGMVEQWDTEQHAALSQSQDFPIGDNIEETSHVPPVRTKSWFHTGAYLGRDQISRQYAREYYGAPAPDEPDYDIRLTAYISTELLPDTVLQSGLTLEEEREACRALKGSMLRQEIYALDGTDKDKTPYTVTEQNFTIRRLQAQGGNRHAVFFTHAREFITYHYERNPSDPRISHMLTLEVNKFGDVLKSASIGYGRREEISVVDEQGVVTKIPNPDLNQLRPDDRDKQTQKLITYTENGVTAPILHSQDNYRTPLPCETRTYELTGYILTGNAGRFQMNDFVQRDPNATEKLILIFDSEIDYEDTPNSGRQRRLIEHVRTIYQNDDLTGPLRLGDLHPLALPFETYKLAFTPGLLTQVYQRPLDAVPPVGASQPENLLPDPSQVLELDESSGQSADRGGYVSSETLRGQNRFPANMTEPFWSWSDRDGHWWIPSGRAFYSPNSDDSPAAELLHARQHFFLPYRYCDPFHTGAISTETFVSYDSHDLLAVATSDALGNVVTVSTQDDNGQVAVRNDYRVLQPYWTTDPNGNRTRVALDALGMVVGTAVMGKPGENLGDSLNTFQEDLTDGTIAAHLQDPFADPHGLLQQATTRLVYDLFAYQRAKSQPDPQPAVVYTLARETHDADLVSGQQTKIQHSFSYSDGFGREIQKKIQAEPGPVPQRDAYGKIIVGADGQPQMTPNDVSPRWVGSGWTVFNNKGKPVRQYEPFFTDTHRFEFDVRIGVSPVLFYDAVERVVATLHPNHTWEKAVFDAWRQETWDVSDTITFEPQNDEDVKGFFIHPNGTARLPAAEYLPTWYALRTDPAHVVEADRRWPDPKMRDAEKAAADKSAVHAETPMVTHADSLGRTFLTVTHNKLKYSDMPPADPPTEEFHPTRIAFDIEANQRAVIDAKERVVMRFDYDMLGNRIHQASMEGGERWMLNDVAGNPVRAWDSRRFLRRMTYDQLRRPTGLYVTENGTERLAEYTVYGEGLGDAANHRTRVHQLFDGAGIVTSMAYDFKGNLLDSRRDLLPNYQQSVNWLLSPTANDGSFTSRTTYDALNRPLTVTTPDGSVYRPSFSEANLLDKVDGNLRGAAAATPFVTNIDYDAKGQRERIAYGNGTLTTYDYDPLTFRLLHLKTTRPANPDATASQLFQNATVVQDLLYTYDPVGNITRIEDAALKTVFHDGQQVEPVGSYTYDATYRLIEVRGREHTRQTAFDFNPPNGNHRDYPFIGHLAHPNDLQALRNYTQRYQYDAASNFEVLRHIASGGSWTRRYDYEEDSLIEAGKKSNRLTKTTLGNGLNYIEPCTHDAHGNMTAMTHLAAMVWDFEDQLQQVALGGGTAYYVYDASGQRKRKVIESQNGIRRQERIYLGGFEIYREYDANGTSVTLERESLHVMDDRQRIALVDTQTIENGNPVNAPAPLQRYQLGNHLGSASVELAENGALISYEEYHPYGTTAFQAGRAAAEVSLKRYRYIGKERDEESGLYYHGARYYAPWLGRWASCDPIGIRDGANLFVFVQNSPIGRMDRTGRQGENSIDDIFTFIRNQAGFQQGAMTPPTFSSSSASPFGTRAHAQATQVLNDLKQIGVKGAERIYSEVAINRATGTVTQIGGSPIRGHHNIDLVAMPRGQSLSTGQTLGAGQAEVVGDIKYGRGTITQAHSNFGQRAVTVNSSFNATPSASTPPTTLTSAVTTGGQAAKAEGAVVKTAQGLVAVANEAKAVAGGGAALESVSAGQKVVRTVTNVVKSAAPIVSKVAPALKVAGQALGAVGVGVSAVQLATAETTEQRVDAGIGLVGGSLMMSKNPVAMAAGGGLFVGQAIEKNLNVSEYSSRFGVAVYENLKEAGLNDTASFVIGGVASVAAIPSAIGYAAALKVASWFK